jgi:hypothetical protein
MRTLISLLIFYLYLMIILKEKTYITNIDEESHMISHNDKIKTID